MTSAKKLETALKEIGIPVKYYEYLGTKDEYIVYNEEAEQQTEYGDNISHNRVTWWQIHIFTGKNGDFRGYKDKAIQLLISNGFNVTDIQTLFEDETDTKTMHVVISVHIEEKKGD